MYFACTSLISHSFNFISQPINPVNADGTAQIQHQTLLVPPSAPPAQYPVICQPAPNVCIQPGMAGAQPVTMGVQPGVALGQPGMAVVQPGVTVIQPGVPAANVTIIQQPAAGTGVTYYPQNVREWTTGLCGCFEDMDTCKQIK